MLLQRAFADLKAKNASLEKVAFTYHLSLQHQKQIELDLMSQLQGQRSQILSLQSYQKKNELAYEGTLKQQKELEKELRLKLKTSYGQAKEMEQQLRQLKSKYEDVSYKL